MQHEGAKLDGIDRLEDKLDRKPVGEVAYQGATGGQNPRLIIHEPNEHLQHA